LVLNRIGEKEITWKTPPAKTGGTKGGKDRKENARLKLGCSNKERTRYLKKPGEEKSEEKENASRRNQKEKKSQKPEPFKHCIANLNEKDKKGKTSRKLITTVDKKCQNLKGLKGEN